MVTNRFLYKKLSYNPDAFEKVAIVAVTPNVLLANPSLPFSTLAEMVAYAKANPGKLTYASFGAGTTSHMAGEFLRQAAGIDRKSTRLNSSHLVISYAVFCLKQKKT